MENLTLSDNQFLKIRLSWTGYAVYFKVIQRGAQRWTFQREIKAALLERLLKDEKWRADLLTAHVDNVVREALRKHGLK